MGLLRRPGGRSLVFLAWLACFYVSWLALVVATDAWGTVVAHWKTALAMALGSYIAGSTPMGGGTVGFPVLTLLLGEPATLGRGFSLAVQSIGMVSASIFLIAHRRPIEWRMLRWALAGSLVSTPLCAWLLTPHVNDLTISLVFAVIWASFGLLHVVRLRAIVRAHGMTQVTTDMDAIVGLAIGALGGAATATTGVGIDMILYSVLVLLYRADLKIAIPTSVIIMASNSVIGLATFSALGGMSPGVYGHWLAAAPIVAIGAPFGAMVVHLVGRAPTLIVVSALCLAQFVWTIVTKNVRDGALAWSIAGVLACNAVFHAMWVAGSRLEKRMPHIGE